MAPECVAGAPGAARAPLGEAGSDDGRHGSHRFSARDRRSGAAGAERAGYTELVQLADVPVNELKALHGMGPKALRVLGEALAEQGLALGGPR
ncbi:DNA-binding protein [Streptomyces sp. NPDC059349]|uniref:DNA-binding protein n=1 Tax=Streptomyces sp. NPDC059349 TaxID=3346808 RepID=UPI0036A2A5E1